MPFAYDSNNLTWQCKPFNMLTPHELYGIMQLRSEVFVVEQNCVYHDADGKDIYCHHITACEDDKLVAYARIVPPDVSYDEASIGRVATSLAARKHGVGKALMHQAIEQCRLLFGETSLRIGAQLYLKRFYKSFGFEQVGEEYDEDGIMHIHMVRLKAPVIDEL